MLSTLSRTLPEKSAYIDAGAGSGCNKWQPLLRYNCLVAPGNDSVTANSGDDKIVSGLTSRLIADLVDGGGGLDTLSFTDSNNAADDLMMVLRMLRRGSRLGMLLPALRRLDVLLLDLGRRYRSALLR